jgi:uncharacterized membrane protein YczE
MMTRRLLQLLAGLLLYGFSMALMLRGAIGLNPWDVFHQGVATQVSWSFGMIVTGVGAAVLLLWIPLRQRPGIGTIANILVIGMAADASLALLPEVDALAWRWPMFLLGVVLNGVAGGAYIGAGLGPGPRDGLMTGIVARTGWPLRTVRTSIELIVLGTGWMMGGTLGIGTLIYALAIGPLVHLFLPLLTIGEGPRSGRGATSARLRPPSAPPSAGTSPR